MARARRSSRASRACVLGRLRLRPGRDAAQFREHGSEPLRLLTTYAPPRASSRDRPRDEGRGGRRRRALARPHATDSACYRVDARDGSVERADEQPARAVRRDRARPAGLGRALGLHPDRSMEKRGWRRTRSGRRRHREPAQRRRDWRGRLRACGCPSRSRAGRFPRTTRRRPRRQLSTGSRGRRSGRRRGRLATHRPRCGRSATGPRRRRGRRWAPARLPRAGSPPARQPEDLVCAGRARRHSAGETSSFPLAAGRRSRGRGIRAKIVAPRRAGSSRMMASDP